MFSEVESELLSFFDLIEIFVKRLLRDVYELCSLLQTALFAVFVRPSGVTFSPLVYLIHNFIYLSLVIPLAFPFFSFAFLLRTLLEFALCELSPFESVEAQAALGNEIGNCSLFVEDDKQMEEGLGLLLKHQSISLI